MAENKVAVEITLEERAALKALTQLTKQVNKTEESFTKMGTEGDEALGIIGEATEGIKDGFGSLVKGVTVANLASEAILGTANAIKNFALGSINAAIEAENSQNRLRQALQSTNSYTEEGYQDLLNYSSALALVTKYGDDEISQQIAIAKSMGATNQQAKDLVRAATELDATFGGGLDANVEKLGKTLSGTAGRLAQMVPGFKDLTEEQLKNGEAIALINERYDGAAASQLESYGGKVALLTKSFGELQEAIGLLIVNSGVANAFSVIAEAINEVTQAMNDNEIAAKRQAGGFTETSASIDQLKRQYDEMRVKAIDLEQKILHPSTNMDQTAIFIAKKQLNELNSEITRTKSLIDTATPAVEAGKAEASRAGAGGVSPVDQEAINSRKAAYAALQQAYVEQAAWEAEQDLLKREITAVNYQAELDQLIGIEQAKIDAKYAAEEEKARIIADSQTRELTLRKIQSDKELAIEKSKIDARKKIDQQFVILENQKQAAIAAAATSGLHLLATVAKDGSREQFLLSKAAAIAQAAMAAKVAYMQALAFPPGPPATIPTATWVAAAGAANVAGIVATAFKGYEQGGLVPGTSFTGDNVIARVNSGEAILNRQQQGNVLMEIANGGGGGGAGMAQRIDQLISVIMNTPITISVDGRAIASVVRKEVQSGFRLA